ncbi:major facilitator superfamily domain-containing protein [Boeremia exigua]|uniref:major facilitator superfamily domain-containing protein n=1 Tax=Boeremia exigua TaxID=749465 RepID=UPI001E8D9A9F|nr:major facilitator superfamily domain-containing protein [Boeremia exigua]KAH6638424.1 major facilitator superfamily domain-containing protein [Boeremia exigua]
MLTSEKNKEVEHERDTSLELDVEENGPRQTLQRQVSGPPYSVFSSRMKIWIIFLVSISALISPFGATLVLPALNVLTDVLDITPTKANISITTYMIAQAIAPAIIGAMSDTSGRRLSFILCYIIYIVANVGLALQTNYVALLILRMVQAVGCSAAISLAFAIVSDIATSAERGKYMGYAGAGILCGPAFGPTIGGILAQFLGWRSIFWFLAIFAGVLLVLFTFLFPETCRNVVGNGSIPARGINRSVISCIQQRKLAKQSTLAEEGQESNADAPPARPKISLNPLATFSIFTEKESCIILLYNGFFFTGMMITTSSIPDLFKTAYNLNELDIGLCYIASGIGSLISSLSMGHVVDWNFRRHAARLNMPISKGKQQDLGDFPIERVKLEIVLPGHVIGILGLIMFGWTVKFQTHLAGPEIALFITGFGISTAFNITNGLLIDLHRDKPAAATAAVNFARCLMSAGGSAAIIPMCRAMNPGWAFTFVGLVYVVLIGVVVWIMRNGLRWRQDAAEASRLKIDGHKEAIAQDRA